MKEPQNLCQGQRNLHVHKIRISSCVRDEIRKWEKTNEKNVLIM
jgi:hypothetical protein